MTPAITLLTFGLSFLAGFATGIAFELLNLLARERQLARGRRLLAAQARGVRQQLVIFYRLRDGAADRGSSLPEFTTYDPDEGQP